MPLNGRAIRLLAGAALVSWLLQGCISEPKQPDYPMLAGSFAAEDRSEPLIADQAYLGNDEFFVRFWRGGQVFYGRGSWPDRISLLSPPEQPRGSMPCILPPGSYGPEPWPSLPEVRHDIRLLGVDDRRDFKVTAYRDLGSGCRRSTAGRTVCRRLRAVA